MSALETGGVAPTSRAKETRSRILIAAYALIRDAGYASFSMGRLAKAAGVAKGNLTYHYPTKREVIEALISRNVEAEIAAGKTRLAPGALAPLERFDRYVEYIVTRNRTPGFLAVIFELYAYASHNPEAALMIATWHRWALAQLIEILVDLRADLSEAERRRIAESVHLMLLATRFSVTSGGPTSARAAQITASAVASARQLVLETRATSVPATPLPRSRSARARRGTASSRKSRPSVR